jgi:hypothetical protein
MVNVNLKEMPRNAGPEYLVAADIGLANTTRIFTMLSDDPPTKRPCTCIGV